MSHGVKRARQSKEATEARKQKEKAKLEQYLSLSDDVLIRKKNKDWTKESFDVTTRLLQINPEFYTIWNYRRNILTRGIFPSCSPEEINEYLSSDLVMTTSALKQHPKVYWIWNHRRWCLVNVPEGPGGGDDRQGWRTAHWERELFIAEKMLDADARNFHAWYYRRHVLANMPVKRPLATELKYTTRKIEANFSNFSAWHQRTKVYTALWEADNSNEAVTREEEFELVKNALYTDPADQSAWLYHRWLIGSGNDAAVLKREIADIQDLLDEQPDSKWCMETLVHYNRLLLRQHAASIGEDAAKTTIDKCVSLLKTLTTIDPMRRARYEDIAASISGP